MTAEQFRERTQRGKRFAVWFVLVYLILVFAYWTFNQIVLRLIGGGELEAGWEITAGILNFPLYETIGVPRIVCEASRPWSNSLYALWFGFLGSIQWGTVGMFTGYFWKRNPYSQAAATSKR
ncbi:MAG: hypothetical protein IT443_01030 [Phycisphaeraceae bacterium]|nr:hypothetical protein [Phycisphaeraceae bacterium]